MRTVILIAIVILLPSSFASTSVGIVSLVRASESTDLIIFAVDGEILDVPRCNQSKTYSFRMSSPGGQGLLELVKVSMLTKVPLAVVGLNTCSRGYETEGIQDVSLG